MMTLLNIVFAASAVECAIIGLPACAIVTDDFRRRRPDVRVIATTLGLLGMAVVFCLMVEV